MVVWPENLKATSQRCAISDFAVVSDSSAILSLGVTLKNGDVHIQERGFNETMVECQGTMV